jgi:hypothetical protein
VVLSRDLCRRIVTEWRRLLARFSFGLSYGI